MMWLFEIMELEAYNHDLDLSVLYHGTSRAKLPKIMAHGLDPQESQSYKDEIANFPDDPGPHHFIYMALNPHTSQDYVDGYKDDPEGGVMLKIKLPPEMINQLVLDRGEYIRSPITIPPEYIEIM